MEKYKGLCLAYSADDNYGKYLGISMLSLFRSNREWKDITVFVLDCGIREATKKKLIAIVQEYNRNIEFINMELAIGGLNLQMGVRKISIASYARLFLSSVIPDKYDKIIYLDCDTIIRASLTELWNINLNEYLVAGVQDTVDSFFLKKIGMEEDEYYINAGVLLINLAKWRRIAIEDKFMDFIDKYKGNVPHHDQGVINALCSNKKYILSPEYNATSNIYSFSAKTIRRMFDIDKFYSQEELDRAKEHPIILHFTTGLVGRPWEMNCQHPMKKEYLKVAKISPWKEEELLPDSRKFSVKIFSALYRHSPLLISETVYRVISKLAHIRE